MPNDSLSEAIKEAYTSAPSNDVVLETIQLSHPLLADDIFLVKNRENITATLETAESVEFDAIGFGLTLPPSGDKGLSELKLSIDNVDPEQRLTDFVNTVKKSKLPVVCYYRVFLNSDLSAPQNSPPLVLTVTNISLTVFEAAGRANFADIINKKCPSDNYTRSRFPSLGG